MCHSVSVRALFLPVLRSPTFLFFLDGLSLLISPLVKYQKVTDIPRNLSEVLQQQIHIWLFCFSSNYLLCWTVFLEKIINFIKRRANVRPYTRSIPKSRKPYKRTWFSTNDTQSSIPTGISWVHQEVIRDERLLLKCTKLFLIPSKTHDFSLCMVNKSASERHLTTCIFSSVLQRSSSTSLTVPGITDWRPNQHSIPHHKRDTIRQCKRRWFASSPELLHMLIIANCCDVHA